MAKKEQDLPDIQDREPENRPDFTIHPAGLPMIKRLGGGRTIDGNIIRILSVLKTSQKNIADSSQVVYTFPHKTGKRVDVFGRFKHTGMTAGEWKTIQTQGLVTVYYNDIRENEIDLDIWNFTGGVIDVDIEIYFTDFEYAG